MNVVSKIAIAVLALALCGCEMRLPHAKTPPSPQPTVVQAAPPPDPQPSGPLSTPQTQVSLPPPQPIDPEALAMPPIPPQEAPPSHAKNHAAKRPTTAPPAVAQAKPEPVETAEAPPTEQPRPPIQPVLPDGQRRQLQEDVASRLREVGQLQDRIAALHLPDTARDDINKIRSFADSAQKALEKGDVQTADGASKRALLLAQELLSGK
jgi:hypothetical protein